jgi:hypothetical protein
MGLTDALLLFRKWRDEGVLVSCISRCSEIFNFSVRGRVTVASDDFEVELQTMDGVGRLRLDLSTATGFMYGESKDAPEPIRSLRPESDSLVVGVGKDVDGRKLVLFFVEVL